MENVAKNRKIYTCPDCDYTSSNKYDFTKHCKTVKHQNAILAMAIDDLAIATSQMSQKPMFECDCGKAYKDNSGLWRHKKQCKTYASKYSEGITTELVLELIRDNKELKQLLIEQNHTIQHQNSTINNLATTKQIGGNNNITTNSHNNAFNLNFYLNETCKEALNISEFVSSIKVSLEDLENTGRKGYIEGISNIIVRNLNGLEHHQRPIHCNDQKREIIYIKDNNEWTKESESKPILTKAIKVIANENIKQIKQWRDKNPDCTNSESKKNNLYLKIVSNSMNGLTEEEGHKNISKIISNVAKETVIHKKYM
jgi:hypothetical protein